MSNKHAFTRRPLLIASPAAPLGYFDQPVVQSTPLMTKKNTAFTHWYRASNAECQRLGIETPAYGAARDAYEIGESPETWSAYVAGQTAD